MTLLETRRPEPRTGRPPTPPRRGPDPLRAAVPAAVWALVAGLVTVAVPVLIAWAADTRSGSGATSALAAVGQVWLVAHGTSMGLGHGEYDLLPLGLAAVPVLLLMRAGGHAVAVHHVADLRVAARLVGGLALSYGTGAAIIAALSSTDGVSPAPVQALCGATLLALLAGGLGVVRAAGLLPELLARVPSRPRLVVRAAATALIGLLGIGALLAAGSLVLHAGTAATLAGSGDPGLLGGLVLLALCLAYLPVAAVWAACWVVGPGFTVGSGTAFGPFSTDPGAVPSLPLLAALPGGPAPTLLGVVVVVLPVLLGALSGELLHRQQARLVDALLVGPLAGLGLAALAIAASGPVGADRLAFVGPRFWLVGPVFAVSVSVGAVATVAVRGRVWRRCSTVVLPGAISVHEVANQMLLDSSPTRKNAQPNPRSSRNWASHFLSSAIVIERRLHSLYWPYGSRNQNR